MTSNDMAHRALKDWQDINSTLAAQVDSVVNKHASLTKERALAILEAMRLQAEQAAKLAENLPD